ncbi:MAG: hypothetical protein P4L49_17175 [Desulfosporosinus sp.]|nr:hypothetical protein [Desulfosporosinus sp.]
MSLDQRTRVVTQISAAVACNALAALRLAVSEAPQVGLNPAEIKEIITLARDIQQQPIAHVAHLTDQLLREPKKTPHEHSADCGCGNHHA